MPSDAFRAEYAVAQEDVPFQEATPYGIGQFVGGAVGVLILTLLLRLVFKRFVSGTNLILASVGSAVALATFLYAFGRADGGPPRFGEGFAQYGIGGVLILIFWLWRDKRRNAANG